VVHFQDQEGEQGELGYDCFFKLGKGSKKIA
jgi:hypothetical protein